MTDYEKDLDELLKDPEFAAGYLTAAMGGMTAVAERAHIKRENLYRTLSRKGNPELRTFHNIIHGLGLKLAIVPDRGQAQR